MNYDPEQDLLKFLNTENNEISDDSSETINSLEKLDNKVDENVVDMQCDNLEHIKKSQSCTHSFETCIKKQSSNNCQEHSAKKEFDNETEFDKNDSQPVQSKQKINFDKQTKASSEKNIKIKNNGIKKAKDQSKNLTNEFSFVTSVSGISTLIFKDQLVDEKEKQNMIITNNLNTTSRIQDRNFDDLKDVKEAAKAIEIIRSHDNEICKELKLNTFKEISSIDFENVSHHNMIDFSILMDYYCLAIVFTLIDQQEIYNQFQHHELNIDYLCNLYESCDMIEKMHRHNVKSIIYRLEGTNLATIFHKIIKSSKILKIQNTSRDANQKLKSDVTNNKIKKKQLVLYSLEFGKKKVHANDNDKIKKINKFENCIIRIEKRYEAFVDAFVAFSRFITLLSTQWKICSVSYPTQFENLKNKVKENDNITYKEYPEMMITMLKHRNLYKQLVYTINSKIEKCGT